MVVGSKTTAKDPLDCEELADVLVEILDRCGVLPEGDSVDVPSWKMMAACLEKLADYLESYANLGGEASDSLQVPDRLLKIEDEMRNVRTFLKQVSHDIDDISVTLELCQALGDICRKIPAYQISSLSASLPVAVRNQRMSLYDTLQSVDSNLGTIYGRMRSDRSNSVPYLTDSLRNAAATLKRKGIKANKGIWKAAQDVLKGLLATREEETVQLEAPSTFTAVEHDPCPPDSSHRCIASVPAVGLQSTSVLNAVDSFMVEGPGSDFERCILIVGPPGSGKTYYLDQIQVIASSKLRGKHSKIELSRVGVRCLTLYSSVIRPSLPIDVMGRKVGSAEDLLLSLISYATSDGKRTILLLDDVESIVGSGFEESTPSATASGGTTRGSTNEPHLMARNRALFLSILELIHRDTCRRTMLICTSQNDFGKTIDRYDRVFVLESPTNAERRRLLQEYVSGFSNDPTTVHSAEIDEALSNVAACTTGLSFAQLTFQCRCAMLASTTSMGGALGFLGAVKSQLEQTIPDSLKTGASSDFMDMRVSTFRDLKERLSFGPDPSSISLYGSSMDCAWEELQRLIVTPICRADALHKLMYHDGESGGKMFAGGVLLSGAPGSGKTSLAYHCAALAASKNPSVKLLDVSCTSLIHKQVGSSEQAIHRLFVTARAAAPCILLMDGIENIAAVRGNDNTTEGTMDRVLSTLLTEIDGVDSGKLSIDNPACLAIIGTTHNPEWVDPALRRPGRLERTIKLGQLEVAARRKIAERELNNIRVSDLGESDTRAALSEISSFIAERTDGFSGASVVGVCNDAKLCASKDMLSTVSVATQTTEKFSITLHHVEEAINSQKAANNPKS